MRKKPSQVCYLMPFTTGYSVPQTEQPRSPRETLPTMYDLPSEFPEEPGLPDEFHDLQPQLLSRTLRLQDYAADNRFTGSNLNLYYDVQHPLWHKRPDWFLALDVPRLYDGHDLRRSYVVWQEGQAPTIVVEFLSPAQNRKTWVDFLKIAIRFLMTIIKFPRAEWAMPTLRPMVPNVLLARSTFMKNIYEFPIIWSIAVIPSACAISSSLVAVMKSNPSRMVTL
ncbi:Uma2 family endonuclease [Leptothoe sp. ISB3NOV94-8A]